MPDTQADFESVLGTLARAESLFASGYGGEDVCKELGVDEESLKDWLDHLSLPQNPCHVLDSCRISDAVFPIFAAASPNAPLDHVGSGVVVAIGDHLFALTVAHVTDHADEQGAIFMPAAEGIEEMTGGLAFSRLPEHGSRAKDKGDMAYFRLSDEWSAKLHPTIKPMSVDDLLLTDDLATGDIFTFVGYPWRKTKRRRGVQETDRATYTGHACAPDIYEKLGYSRFVHVVMRMRRKKTYSSRYESRQIAPHPQGISGGAVIAWPWSFIDRHDGSKLKLAAIGHTYHEREHCMAATRIVTYMMGIVRNNPGLAIHFPRHEVADEFSVLLAERLKAINPRNVPTAVGIAWYRPGTYTECVNIFDDGDDLPATFHDWLPVAQRIEQQLAVQGMRTVRVYIDPATFPAWCSENGFAKIDRNARIAFGNAMALEALQQGSC
jgi:hypothetical protein